MSSPADNEIAFTAGFTADLVATLELFRLYVHMALVSKILHQHVNNVKKIFVFKRDGILVSYGDFETYGGV